MLTIHSSRNFYQGVEISHNGGYKDLLKELRFLFSIKKSSVYSLTTHDLRHKDIFPVEMDCFWIFSVWDNKLFVHPGIVWQLCEQLELKFSKEDLQSFIDDDKRHWSKVVVAYYKDDYIRGLDLCKRNLVEFPLKVLVQPPGVKRAQLEMLWEMTILKKNLHDFILARL